MDLQQIAEELESVRVSIEQHYILMLSGADPEKQIGAVYRDLERINRIARKMNEMKL